MYEMEVNAIENAGLFKASVTVTFDNAIKVTGVKLMEKKDGSSWYIQMPQYKTKEVDEENKPVYKPVCEPRNSKFAKELLDQAVLLYVKAAESGTKEKGLVDGAEHVMTANVTPFTKEGSNLLGVGTLYLGDDFKVNNVTIAAGRNFNYVNMPQYDSKQTDAQGHKVYRDYAYAVDTSAWKRFHSVVENAYETAKVKSQATESQAQQQVMKNNEFMRRPATGR